jgi:uncharacterized protein (DUF427 family)
MAQALEDKKIKGLDRPWGVTARFEDSHRRVRVVFANTTIADSKRVRLLLEPMKLGIYYFPLEDVRPGALRNSGERLWDVVAGERVAQRAAWEREEFPGYVAFKWDLMDRWFEEDEEVFVHPRDPYHRVDVLNSSRHVKVVLGGEVVAESDQPRLLLETNLPTRYYIPKVDVRMDLLTPTDLHTRCPYKGEASYWTVRVNGQQFENIVWSYPAPIPEIPKIENLLCFYNEKVDAIYVDGELQPKPKSPWS